MIHRCARKRRKVACRVTALAGNSADRDVIRWQLFERIRRHARKCQSRTVARRTTGRNARVIHRRAYREVRRIRMAQRTRGCGSARYGHMIRWIVARAKERDGRVAQRTVTREHVTGSRPRYDRRRADKTLSCFVASCAGHGADHRMIHSRARKRCEAAGRMAALACNRSGRNVIAW